MSSGASTSPSAALTASTLSAAVASSASMRSMSATNRSARAQNESSALASLPSSSAPAHAVAASSEDRDDDQRPVCARPATISAARRRVSVSGPGAGLEDRRAAGPRRRRAARMPPRRAMRRSPASSSSSNVARISAAAHAASAGGIVEEPARARRPARPWSARRSRRALPRWDRRVVGVGRCRVAPRTPVPGQIELAVLVEQSEIASSGVVAERRERRAPKVERRAARRGVPLAVDAVHDDAPRPRTRRHRTGPRGRRRLRRSHRRRPR